ncbi:unnamed protein product [Trichogramma brassicae]|uniref:Reverse transcriptase domain-containing protein n=1 Tax=Trichogramma brassicae TaxID=86971 RepID=A0A6H5IMI3_9HYME|nr:unnamed protein product [Trichogramma brassicae]
MNDLPEDLVDSRCMLFADDLQVYSSFFPKDFTRVLSAFNRNVNAVSAWATANGLSLNRAKTQVMLMGSDAFLRRFDLSTTRRVLLEGMPLLYTTVVKSLGVYIQPNLDSGAHVKQVVKRVHRVLYSLRHHRKALLRPIRKELVESLIFLHFDYACAVYNDLFQYQEIKLQRALNACVRYVVDCIGWMDHVTPHRLALGWLSTARRRQYFIASIAYTAISFNNPSYLLPRFTMPPTSVTERSSKRLPQRSLIHRKTRETSTIKASFYYTATDLINSLFPEPVNFNPQFTAQFKTIVFLGKSHPDLYSLIREFQKEQGDTEIGLIELSNQRRIKSAPKKKWVDVQRRLRALVETYDTYGLPQLHLIMVIIVTSTSWMIRLVSLDVPFSATFAPAPTITDSYLEKLKVSRISTYI